MEKIISSFVDILIDQKKLQFSLTEINPNNLLFKNNILKKEDNQIVIANFKIITPYFIEKYKDILGFQIYSFDDTTKFIKSVIKDFNSKSYVYDSPSIEKEIWKYFIIKANSEEGYNFTNYLSSVDLKKKPKGIYNFIEGYSAVMPDLKLTATEIFENAIILADITKSDAEYNFDLGNVLNSIRKKCCSDYETGLILLEKFLVLEGEKENIISAAVAGLYDSQNINFYKSVLEKLIETDVKRNPIFFGLSKISKIENSDCDLFINIFTKYWNIDSLEITLLSLIFSIVKSENVKYLDFCFQAMISGSENEKNVYFILSNLGSMKTYSEQKTNVIVKLISQDYFSIEKYLHRIGHLLWDLDDLNCFSNILLSIIKAKPFERCAKNFKTLLIRIERIALDELIIGLLTNYSASKRFIGRDIFQEMSTHQPYKFSLDIVKLPTLSQYKLLVSLTQDFYHPKDSITSLLPLLYSKSPFVKGRFLRKLEQISEDYGGHVIDIFKNNLDLSIPVYKEVVDRITHYIEDFYQTHTGLKNSILEFNPYNTHYKSIRNFNDLFHKNFNKSLDLEAKEDSLFSILGAESVQLAKGGGFRMGAQKEISQLNSFGSSFTMPRSYFINPNKYDLEKGLLLRQDWVDENFTEIKKILNNEQ